MIFLDTSAIYALADAADLNHEAAVELAGRASSEGEILVVHNYVVVEAVALLQRRLGLDVTTRFLRGVGRFRMHWVTESEHGLAVEHHARAARRQLSLVDCVSFVVMRRLEMDTALAFDRDFQAEGFLQYR